MAVIGTGNNPKAMWPGINAVWGTSYGERPLEYTDLFEVKQSSMQYEELVEATGFGLASLKPAGTGIAYDSDSQQTVSRFTHDAYALGFIVTHEEMKDNLYQSRGFRRTRNLAYSMRITKEIVHANVYNRAFNASYLGGDGSALCVTNHGSLSGSQSNTLATAADISESSLEDLTIQIYGAVNNRGLQIPVTPQTLIVHRNDWYEANRILKSVLQNDLSNNAINALRSTNALPGGIKMNHYLTDTDAFFIRTDIPESMISFQREDLLFDEDNDGDTKNQKYNAYERYVAFWGDWRGLYGSAGA